ERAPGRRGVDEDDRLAAREDLLGDDLLDVLGEDRDRRVARLVAAGGGGHRPLLSAEGLQEGDDRRRGAADAPAVVGLRGVLGEQVLRRSAEILVLRCVHVRLAAQVDERAWVERLEAALERALPAQLDASRGRGLLLVRARGHEQGRSGEERSEERGDEETA